MIRKLYNVLLRPHLPDAIGVDGGVATRRRKMLDRSITEPEYERIANSALDALVRHGDHVVIVGGGHGVTAVTAAKKAGPGGHVDVFETLPNRVDEIREVAELNGVGDRVEVHRATVSDAADLPDCDVLEVDCEGCEAGIISTIDDRPRVTIVEHHARQDVEDS